MPLRLVGRGEGTGGPIEVEASRKIVFAQQGTLPTSVVSQNGLPAATALPTPVTLDAPAGPIEVAHGFGASIPVKAERTKGADAALAITPYPLPPGLAVPAATVADKADRRDRRGQYRGRGPPGPMTIGLQAKGKFAGGEQTIAIPAVTLSRPPRRGRPGGRLRRGEGGDDGRDQGQGRPQGGVQGARHGQGQRPARGPQGRPGHRRRRARPTSPSRSSPRPRPPPPPPRPRSSRRTRSTRRTTRPHPCHWR